MSFLRFGWRALALLVWVVLGLVVLVAVFPILNHRLRQVTVQRWSAGLLRLCGVQTEYSGQIVTDQSVLFVMNHVSWLDIFVVTQQRSTSFIAKSEIRQWPLIGWLVTKSGTVFIERGQRQAIKHVASQMQQKFAHGLAVGLFPEGTTSDGLAIGPFHSSLFQTALDTEVDIQPIALRFYDQTQRSTRIAFVGEQSLLQNLWVLLSRPGVRIECDFLTKLSHQTNSEQGRAATAHQAHQIIKKAVLKGL